MKIFYLFIVLLFSLSIAQIDSTSLDYFPLDQGNIWQYSIYRWSEFSPGRTSHRVVEVVGDTMIMTKKYIIIAGRETGDSNTYYDYFRIDSSTTIIYRYFNGRGELEYYKLNCAAGDTALQYNLSENKYYYFRCSGSYDHEYLDHETTTKIFSYSQGLAQYGYRLSKDLGISQKSNSYMANGSSWSLIYAKIKDEEFGSPTAIEEENKKHSSDFQLFQNYPNPYNSSTKILFTLPSTEDVTIEVFNILGQIVTTLLDKQLNAGDHTIDFISGNLPSGIYFYRIKAGTFQEYKKMILLR